MACLKKFRVAEKRRGAAMRLGCLSLNSLTPSLFHEKIDLVDFWKNAKNCFEIFRPRDRRRNQMGRLGEGGQRRRSFGLGGSAPPVKFKPNPDLLF